MAKTKNESNKTADRTKVAIYFENAQLDALRKIVERIGRGATVAQLVRDGVDLIIRKRSNAPERTFPRPPRHFIQGT